MRVRVVIASWRTDERGGVLVMVALWLPLLVVMLIFVVDVGNWWVHKRHLQMQADAAALAAAQAYQLPCSDTAITSRAASYSGGTYNAQIGGTPASRVHMLINSKTFFNQPSPTDDTTASPPCSAGMIDVKMTETDLPWFFRPVGGFLSGIAPSVPFINAQARVSIDQIDSSSGALPVGVPDVNPRSARAYFIHESTGAVIASAPLTRAGTSNGMVVWDNAGSPQDVTVSSTDTDVGVVIALGGTSSTTCGQPLVQCYDGGAALNASSMPTTGLLHIQGWSAAGSGAQPGAPLLRQATLAPGTCSDPYFNVSTTSCTFGLQAKVDFGATDPVTTVGAQLTATVGKSSVAMTYSAATGLWSSPTTFTMAPAAGPLNVSLDWAETKGTQGANTCSTSGGNKCKGTFGVVQRAFGGDDIRSGPIQVASVWENGAQWANALERCSAIQTSCTHKLVVRIAIKGNLANASSASDPVVALRVVGGSQNQSLDCDPNLSKLKDEIASGCAPRYARNTGTACPGSATTLWGSAQPWTCVAIQTGSATNQVPAGMNQRVLGSDQAATCTAPNHWSQFPNLNPSDPRIIEVLLTPFSSFSGNGSTTVPVTDFATFYVTGWTGQGMGFNNPCQGNGDDPVPNNDAGYIVGHFIKYIQTLNPGGGTTPCDLTAFGACVAVMTR